ncbi:hypothetical protein BBO99_00005337 [Phytophthora kernoviae]|uniref:Elicitin n=1 Tax=Phytophthora kernoviae TaxID=325452 RepID=A0A3R7G3H7_9STRA|nr:hypothetical protein JM16_003270 [Phytophthora kernoviae]KAG2524475.1 hypothetical protein JM18_002974 [Phytophthora kernoviae]RLN21628.1 hypothetical protein BBI17_003593 [Phytophthora kernoviae]RLN79329.1 hypothetical protein BBO99_00005337 [Phytophthora kernoviae]
MVTICTNPTCTGVLEDLMDKDLPDCTIDFEATQLNVKTEFYQLRDQVWGADGAQVNATVTLKFLVENVKFSRALIVGYWYLNEVLKSPRISMR